MPSLPLAVRYESFDEFRAAFDAEIARKGLLVRGASLASASAGAAVDLSVTVPGLAPVMVSANIAAVVPGVGVAVMFSSVPPALAQLARGSGAEAPPLLDAAALSTEAEVAEEDDAARPPGPLSERLKAMSVNDKMKLALAGTRDERAALLRDNNKTLHLFVLKNPRIGLDEIQAAAKLPQLSPDAIKYIAEHREWGNNATICTSLVRNPKTPMPLALRMVDKVPINELRAIAKGGARDAIVNAARKKIAQ